ncbi:MAG: sensor histidine kinase [Planctomycetes bacterium]|nr:sensor histidine kinase [Planctomycetota bacterium]MBL7040003.1 sensor histidine kinase [Pirellulaceae bacterium]
MSKTSRRTKRKSIPLAFHPRVFSALGSDLVTNDLVAITELVKNSYDAFADRVDVRFGSDGSGEFIEIQDDGEGMSLKIIRDVWCMVGTPYRLSNPTCRKGTRARRASGEKGLGRLSAARLGNRLEMLTKAKSEPCWEVRVDWDELAESDDLSTCTVDLNEVTGDAAFKRTGTRIRIYNLKSEWDEDRVEELEDHLSRMVSPFKTVEGFSIWLSRSEGDTTPTRITPQEFLKFPKYALEGTVDETGSLKWCYSFRLIGSKKVRRSIAGELQWKTMREERTAPKRVAALENPNCGPFSFEIRGWDVDLVGVRDIADHYDLDKRTIRQSIGAYKGISVYRDGILVLPKSENSRDWLGLDRRRISDVGKRLSTTQLVGYARITADANPKIKDTSDRERLVDLPEVQAFEHILRCAVATLESERQTDRIDEDAAEKPLAEIFEGLSAEDLVEDVVEAADEGASAKDALQLVKKHERNLAKTRKEIERRFIYYSQLATVGTIAEFLVHEVRNRTTTINAFVRAVLEYADEYEITEKMSRNVERAENAIASLARLAETFAPLANRSFRRGKRSCDLVDRVKRLLDAKSAETDRLNIDVIRSPGGSCEVAVDPGEMDAILLNLFENAFYWLGQKREGKRQLAIRLGRLRRKQRVEVTIEDSGPGVPEEYESKIFLPGVTRKPNGIGMGLTIASELIVAYGGQMKYCPQGNLSGATFVFDLPLKK